MTTNEEDSRPYLLFCDAGADEVMAENLTYWRQFPGEEPQELPRDSWLLYADGLDPETVERDGFTSRFGTRYWTEKGKP